MYRIPPLVETSPIGTLGWFDRLDEEIRAMESFERQQEEEGGVHTKAWPASWEEAQELGIDVQEEDIATGAVWSGFTELFKNGRRLLVLVLPVNYPREHPRLWIHELAGLARHRLAGGNQQRACLTIHEWTPDHSIAGLLAEGLEAFVADVNGERSMVVER